MANQTISIIIDIVREIAYTFVFLAAAAVTYLTLQRPKVKEWLRPAGVLVQVVAFVALTVLLYWPPSYVVGDLFAFPEALIAGSQLYYPGIRCFGGVLICAVMIAGIVLLARGAGQDGTGE